MSLVRALVRRGVRELTVVTGAVAGLQADLLIAAGCVKRVISSYLALEELGLAPNFRRAAEEVRGALRSVLGELRGLTSDELVQRRYAKFRRMGVFEEAL